MPEYKLYYFPLKGRGEVLRLMFVYAGVEFQDIRVSFKEWPSLKNEMPYKQMPVLEVDGIKYCQSNALVRFLARELGLSGKTSLEFLKADEFSEACYDVMMKLPWTERDDEKKKELTNIAFNETIPPLLALMEANLKEDYCAGKSLTYGDIVYANGADYLKQLRPDVLEATPKLKSLYNRVMSCPNIADYISQRPPTDM